MKVCKTCKVAKTLDQFSAGRRACKKCRAAEQRLIWNGLPVRPIYLGPEPAGMKQCNGCGITKPFEMYTKQADCRDGYVGKCKACRVAQSKVYVASLGDAYRQMRRERYPYDPVYDKAWRTANPEKVERRTLVRSKRLKAAMVDPHVTKAWLRRRDGDDCYYCGVTLDFEDKGRSDASAHLEHKVPVSRGGLHSEDNCVLSCRKCNLTKGTRVLA